MHFKKLSIFLFPIFLEYANRVNEHRINTLARTVFEIDISQSSTLEGEYALPITVNGCKNVMKSAMRIILNS